MPAERRGDPERHRLVERQVDPRHCGARLVVADRTDGPAWTAPDEVAHEPEAHRGDDREQEVLPQALGVAAREVTVAEVLPDERQRLQERRDLVERQPARRLEPGAHDLAARAARVRLERVELHDRGEDGRETERHQREVEALDAQRGEPEDHAEREARRHDDHERGEERPPVIGHEPRRDVRAGAHEEALPESELAGEADHHLQAEDRDHERDRLVQPDQADVVAVVADRELADVGVREPDEDDRQDPQTPGRPAVQPVARRALDEDRRTGHR
jgi:hypothetical protein